MIDFDNAWGASARRRVFATFTGEGAEYFRIWTVNTLLTVLTLGVYLAWAKVRKRRYFYWNTYLDGARFDYLAKPGAILLGHGLVVAAIVLAKFGDMISPAMGAVATFSFYLLIPWLVYKSHRFKARNSSFRGIRFRFLGTAREAYKLYALLPGVIFGVFALIAALVLMGESPDPLLAGLLGLPSLVVVALLYPLWIYQRRIYTFSNLAYGNATAVFEPNLRFFYSVYLKAFGLAFAGLFAAFVAISTGFAVLTVSPWLREIGPGSIIIVLASFAAVYYLLEQYVWARITSHCWSSLRLGDISFEVDLDPWRLLFIKLTNTAAVVGTLGFYAPWAEVRRYGYIVSRFSVLAGAGIDGVAAGIDTDVTAVGDAALDIFDMDLGW